MTCNCEKIVEQRKVLHRSGKSRQEAIWHIFWTGNISAIMHLVSLTCVLQDMSNELDIGKIVAELSGTTAEQAKSLIAQREGPWLESDRVAVAPLPGPWYCTAGSWCPDGAM